MTSDTPSRCLAIDRDADGVARQLRHLQDPYTDATIPAGPPAERAQRLVVSYLRRMHPIFGLTRDHVDHLAATVGSDRPAEGPGIQFRWAETDRAPRPIRRGQSTACWIRQTFSVPQLKRGPIDVWQAGLRIVVHHQPFRITSAASTLLLDIDPTLTKGLQPEPFAPEAVRQLFAELLGVPAAQLGPKEMLLVYRRRAEDLRDAVPGAAVASSVPDETDLVVVAREEELGPPEDRRAYRVFADPQRRELAFSKSLIACAFQPKGRVFRRDPASKGSPRRSDDASDALDAVVDDEALTGLPQPPSGAALPLHGDLVTICDEYAKPGGPQALPPYAFDYPVRTDQFAAVSAYFHCDRLFRELDRVGAGLGEIFNYPGQFPVPVLPHAAIVPGPCVDGNCINAQVRQTAWTNRVAEFRFALGDVSDLQNRLGAATDPRWAWHEFGHALLIAATWLPELPFAHSCGDALAAIACDADSALAGDPDLRGITFPWIWQPIRRHDRDVGQGWGWYGALYEPWNYPELSDPGGYRAEQILSSTLFRLYRALGGDAVLAGGGPDRARRRIASDYVLYLVTTALAQLGDGTATPAASAEVLATAIMEADVATQVFQAHGNAASRRLGGAVHKVVRWAFEQQGLYFAPGTPHPQDREGPPEPVDVFIDDGRRGEYRFTDDWEASATSLWLRDAPDGAAADQPPAVGKPSCAYVRVENRGTEVALATEVAVYAAAGAKLGHWDNTWTRLVAPPGAVTTSVVAPGGDTVFGPFEWTPAATGAAGLLAVASAPADIANTLASTGLACAAGPTPLGDLVPFDNNLGLRRWTIA